MIRIVFILISFTLFACGGSDGNKAPSGPNNNPPNVAGFYSCISSCSGICEYTSVLVTQNGSNLVAALPFGSCSGSINNNGIFNAQCEDDFGEEGSCNGNFAGELFTVKCKLGATQCQQAAFLIQ